MRIQRFFVYLYSVAAIATLIVAGLVVVLMRTLENINDSQETQHRSYLLSDELRQSSDDLTRRTGCPCPPPIFTFVLERNGNPAA